METENNAYSTITIKGIDDDHRIITGIASTPSTDRDGDIIVPEGMKFKTPFPLLAQHNHNQPIGQVTAAVVTAKGLMITAKIAKNSGLGYVEDMWKQIKAGLVRGLSIGFRGIKAVPIGSGIRFDEIEIHELSAVTIPANAEASIVSVKNYCAVCNALSSTDDEDVDHVMALHDAKEKAAASLATIQKNLKG